MQRASWAKQKKAKGQGEQDAWKTKRVKQTKSKANKTDRAGKMKSDITGHGHCGGNGITDKCTQQTAVQSRQIG